MISRNMQALLDHYELKRKQSLKRFHMNGIPLSDRSVRLLTAPAGFLIAEKTAQIAARRKSWFEMKAWLSANAVRKEHRVVFTDFPT